MASHARQQIRDAVATAVTGLTTTADRVFVGRARPLAAGHLPTLLIYTQSETSVRAIRGQPAPTLERSLTLYIEGRVSTATPPDNDLDTIAAEVEAAMWVDPSLAGRLLNLQFVATEQQVEAQSERYIGGIRLEYRATYRTVEGAPTTIVTV